MKESISRILPGDIPVNCRIVLMGRDIAVAVYGGDTPHIGSVVMAISRPSLTGKGISVTSSVLNAVGHKDEAVARRFAETIAKAKECTVVCNCGIHVDHITGEQLKQVQKACEDILGEILRDM